METPGDMRWMMQWLWFFGRNRDYWAYCKAKRIGRADVCERLEREFPRIAELYSDWRDIHAVDLFSDVAAQCEWWKPMRHLFYDLPRVVWIEDPKVYEHRPGYMLVELPLMDTKAATMRVFEQFADLTYGIRARAQESTKPAMRLALQARSGAKYTFHPDGGKLSAATRKAIAKAIYADKLRRTKGQDGKALSLTDTVLAIKQDPKNPFGWSLTDTDKRDIATGMFKKGLFASSEITLVKRARKDFDAYVRNTIHGRFPDNS